MPKKPVRRPSSPGIIPSAVQTPGLIAKAATPKHPARTQCAPDNRSRRTDSILLRANIDHRRRGGHPARNAC
jgi:hypothetical protein